MSFTPSVQAGDVYVSDDDFPTADAMRNPKATRVARRVQMIKNCFAMQLKRSRDLINTRMTIGLAPDDAGYYGSEVWDEVIRFMESKGYTHRLVYPSDDDHGRHFFDYHTPRSAIATTPASDVAMKTDQ